MQSGGLYAMLMRSRTILTLVLATTGLYGCGDDDGVVPDAGSLDAGSLDAGSLDAGPADAGPADAGALDAGPRTPLEMSRDEARAAVGEAGLALAAIPEAERIDAEFLELDVTFARLDAVIGEKSTSLIGLAGVIGEKSLPINAVPALVVARQLARASRDIDAQLTRTGWATTTIPELLALGMRLAEARDALQMLSDVMWDRYRTIVDSVDPTSFPEDVEYADARSIQVLPEGAELQAIIEGSAGAATASITADCTEQPFQIRIVDEERGTELLSPVTEPMFNTWTVALPEGTPSSVRVELRNPSVTAPTWLTCNVSVAGTRHWRGAQIELDSAESSAIGLLLMDWIDASGALSAELQRLDSAGTADERAVAAKVRAYVAELYGTTGAWRGTRTSWYEDDYEIYDLTLSRVLDPMGVALATSPQLADARFDPLRSALASLRSVEDMVRQTLAPTHTGI